MDDELRDYEKLEIIFDEFNEEYLKFEEIENKLSTRADLHAFLLLDSLFPNKAANMVSGASHDEIYLEIDPEELYGVATKEQILELIRCGVMYSDDSLTMFV